MKYPKGSLPHQPSTHVADKKFGYFQSEREFFDQIATDMGMIEKGHFLRHPLAYLVEAADDICYTIIDFEDGINLGWIAEDYALEYLIKLVKDRMDTEKYAGLKFTTQRMSYLRSLAINSLIFDAVDRFLAHEQEILAGTFPHALLDKSKYKAQMDDIIAISVKNVYQSEEVLHKEIIGYKVLSTLLSAFTTAAVNTFNGETTAYDKLMLRLVPDDIPLVDKTLYKTLLNTTSFIARLSDGKAMELAEKMK